jgi:hypothetical protein
VRYYKSAIKGNVHAKEYFGLINQEIQKYHQRIKKTSTNLKDLQKDIEENSDLLEKDKASLLQLIAEKISTKRKEMGDFYSTVLQNLDTYKDSNLSQLKKEISNAELGEEQREKFLKQVDQRLLHTREFEKTINSTESKTSSNSRILDIFRSKRNSSKDTQFKRSEPKSFDAQKKTAESKTPHRFQFLDVSRSKDNSSKDIESKRPKSHSSQPPQAITQTSDQILSNYSIMQIIEDNLKKHTHRMNYEHSECSDRIALEIALGSAYLNEAIPELVACGELDIQANRKALDSLIKNNGNRFNVNLDEIIQGISSHKVNTPA